MPPAPLLDSLARLIEATFDITPSLVPLGRFVVGDEGHRRIQSGRVIHQSVDHDGFGARLLLRPLSGPSQWAVALYLPDEMIEHLERHDPRREIHGGNIDAFAALIEEIDHLVVFSERALKGGPGLSMLEMEWHAGVSKYLVLSHFVGRLTGKVHLARRERDFLEHHLFHKSDYVADDENVQDRYRRANRLAYRFVRTLRRMNPHERLVALRRFHRATHHEKMRVYA